MRRNAEGWFCWSWVGALAATGGTILGIGVGGVLGLMAARLAGIPDYGGALNHVLVGASVVGAVGCYGALALARDSRAVPTVLFVLVLLSTARGAADLLTGAIAAMFSTTFGTAISIAVFLYVLIPLLAPLIARFLAALVPWPDPDR
ncbi:MAG: hypothetical protein M3535_04065 [Actinomycetota bacterium]|jgi:hypothetical protein|nr:hypothetical protein [Actinomycetota bacterium]